MYQKLFNLKSAEEADELDHNEDIPQQPPKFINQSTTIFFKHKNTIVYDFQSEIQCPLDCSFEQTIHKQNIQTLKKASIKFLQESSLDSYTFREGFKDSRLYDNLPFEVTSKTQLDILTRHNDLLNEKQRQQLMNILIEQDLIGMAKEIPSAFGVTVGKQLVFGIYHLLKVKLQSYKALTTLQSAFLPKFDCFYGVQESEKVFATSCPIYDDINLDQISIFAEKGVDDLISLLYNSPKIKYLTLRESRLIFKEDIFQKFKIFMKQLSKTVFFSLAGAIQPTNVLGSSLFNFDLSREVSFSEFSELSILNIQRSISRPFTAEEEEKLSKKQKTE